MQNCMSGLKLMHHPEVGTLELNFEVLAQPDESGHWILIYTADEDSPAAGLQLLAAYAKTAPRKNGFAHLQTNWPALRQALRKCPSSAT